MKALVLLLALAIPVRAHAKGCHEVSGVVGYEKCSWFGQWSRDVDVAPVFVELMYYHHDYISQPYSLDAAAAHESSPDSLASTAVGPMMRIMVGRLFYAGLEGGGGWVSKIPQPMGVTQPAWASEMEGHAVGGIHVALWRLGLGVEVAAGGRMEVLASCDPKTDPKCMQVQTTQTRRDLDLRAHVDLFWTPTLTLGFMMGKSLIDDGDREYFLYTGFHFRALDGAP